jgi:hypothetical protein
MRALRLFLLALASCTFPRQEQGSLDRDVVNPDSALSLLIDKHAIAMGLPALGTTGTPTDGRVLRFWVDRAFDSTIVITLVAGDSGWAGQRVVRPAKQTSSVTDPVTWDSLQGREILEALSTLDRRPVRPRNLEVNDGCTLIIEERQGTQNRLWYFDNPQTFRTRADSLAISIVSRVLAWAGLGHTC